MHNSQNDIENFLSDRFTSYKVEPRAEVWKKVSRKIWKNNFYKPGFKQLNVFNISIVAGAAAVGLMFLLPPSNTRSDTPSILPESQVIVFDSVKLSDSKSTLVKAGAKDKAVLESKISGSEIIVLHKTDSVNLILSQKADDLQILGQGIEDVENSKADNNEEKVFNQQTQVFESGQRKKLDSIEFIKYLTWNNIKNSGVYLPVSFRYIEQDFERKPVMHDFATLLTGDMYFNMYRSVPLISATNGESMNYASQLKAKTSPSLAYGYGATVNFRVSNFETSIGFGITNFEERFSKNIIHQKIDSTLETNVIVNNYYEYDTIGWETTSDSVYSPVLDSVLIVSSDTERIFTTDTLMHLLKNQVRSKIVYFEIPITFSYHFQYKNVGINPRVGIIAGLLQSARGVSLGTNGPNSYINYNKRSLPFSNTIFSLYAAVQLDLRYDKRWIFIVEPFYRRSLGSVFNESYFIQKKYELYGLKAGVRYIF